MAEAKEKKSRKSRKHKREEDMVEMVEEADTVSRKSKKSKKEKKSKRDGDGTSEKRSKKSKKSKKSDRAYMADDIPVPETQAPPAGAEIPAADAEVERAVENGEFNSEMLNNVDAADMKKLNETAFKKTSANCRGRMHDCMDDVEIFTDIMLTDALNNKASRQRVLQQRTKILKILWSYREIADCEDDFDNEEFHGQMRVLATIQRKLKGLDSKIGAMMMGAEGSSSDSDGQGEMDGLKKLKTARQNLRYAMNQGTFVA